MQTLPIVLASLVLYFALGRALLALYGRMSKEPIGLRAWRAAYGGRVADTNVTGRRAEAETFVLLLWLTVLTAWPLFLLAQGVAAVVSRSGKDRAVSHKGFTVGLSRRPRDED